MSLSLYSFLELRAFFAHERILVFSEVNETKQNFALNSYFYLQVVPGVGEPERRRGGGRGRHLRAPRASARPARHAHCR